MSNKSYVSMETNQCPVCLAEFETGSILLERRFKSDRSGLMETMETKTMTGHSPCPECKGHLDNDMIALIVIDPAKSGQASADGKIGQDKAYRTGESLWLRRKVALDMFGEGMKSVPIAYIDKGIYDKLVELSKGAQE